LQVVAEAGDGVYALQAIKTHRPDIVLMDITLPYLNGIEATRKIRSNFPNTKVIILTMHSDQAFSDIATQAGACQFLTKDCSKEKILQAIRECLPGPLRVARQPAHQ
jgi:two-component system nitrate/nitrite response regulator NarL